MKRFILIFSIFISLLSPALLGTSHASAVNIFKNTCDKYLQENGGNKDKLPASCQDVEAQKSSTSNPIIKIINAAISIVSFVIGVAAVIGIIINGIRFMVANGDPSAVSSARSGLVYSLIGLAIAVLAQSVVLLVLKKI